MLKNGGRKGGEVDVPVRSVQKVDEVEFASAGDLLTFFFILY